MPHGGTAITADAASPTPRSSFQAPASWSQRSRNPAWVAEQPEIHLRPHVEAWCQRDQRLALTDAHTDDMNAYILDLDWCGASASVGEARAAAFALIGSFAESATYARQRRVASDGGGSPMKLQFEVGMGELGAARFDPHGHVVVINLAGVL